MTPRATGNDVPLSFTVTPVKRATGIQHVVEGWSWGDDRQVFYGIGSTGRVVAWGAGDLGQLGNGTSPRSSVDGVVVERLIRPLPIVSANPQDVPWGPRTAGGLTDLRWATPWIDAPYRNGVSYMVLRDNGTVQQLKVPYQQPTS